MDLRTQLKKFYLYVETVHDDGDWSPDNVVDKYLQSQHGGKPIVSGSLPLAQIEELLNSITDDQRLSLIGSYCHGCGSTDKNCQCWNDD